MNRFVLLAKHVFLRISPGAFFGLEFEAPQI
jgi:hypothetical protein